MVNQSRIRPALAGPSCNITRCCAKFGQSYVATQLYRHVGVPRNYRLVGNGVVQNAIGRQLFVLLICLTWTVGLLPAQTSTVDVVDLSIEPTKVVLTEHNRQQQLLITAHWSDGTVTDVTHQCSLNIKQADVALVRDARVELVKDGCAELEVTFANQQAVVPISVVGAASFPEVDFGNDVVPIFSKLGCNGGGCHGRVQGQNGFRLSVFGFDPTSDYESITQQGRGRRVFPGDPRGSLLIQKAIALVPHGGGRRLVDQSLDYHVLCRWIEQGLPAASSSSPKLESLDVLPKDRVLKAGQTQQILATARFSDGSIRDVTQSAQFASNASSVAEVSSAGLVRCGPPYGEAAITVNYMGKVGVVRIQRPRDLPADEQFAFHGRDVASARASQNQHPLSPSEQIDALVQSKMRTMNIIAAPIADDATFLRRLFLDVTGTLPSPDDVREFLADQSEAKRTHWIERALQMPAYADLWALKWADVLLVDKEKLGDRGAFEFHRWLRDQFQRNVPYDQWVQAVVTATGNSGRSGPVNLYRVADTPDALARTISQAFLGVRLECAQCHHHPFDTWSQSDFYGIAGFFNGLERKTLSTDRTLLFHKGFQPMVIPQTNIQVSTRALGQSQAPDLTSGDPRSVLAKWMVAPENPWFAKMFVNRLWKHLMGRGLVEPEDDMRMTNPPTNEALMDYLARLAIEWNYDQKRLMRAILGSNTYQSSSIANQSNYDDDQHFSRYRPKRLSAEVLLDAIDAATGSPERFPGQPLGTRAIELWDNRLPSYFLEIFGRPARNSPCECGRSQEPTMAQALHLANAPEVEDKISSKEGRVAQLVQRLVGTTVRPLTTDEQSQVVEELCLATVSRKPSEKEMQLAKAFFEQSPPIQAAEDFLWTMLNSYDFLFVH